jgi:hypothetical protein
MTGRCVGREAHACAPLLLDLPVNSTRTAPALLRMEGTGKYGSEQRLELTSMAAGWLLQQNCVLVACM